MSDDLKGRLRKLEGGDKYGSTVWYRNPDGPEAASRIEKLETALLEIAEDCELESGLVQGTQACAIIARKALEGKDDVAG